MLREETQQLIERLFKGSDAYPRRIEDASEQLGAITRTATLDSIVDLDPVDGGIFAARLLVPGARNLDYFGIHNDPRSVDAAYENMRIFSLGYHFEKRLSERGHVPLLSKTRRKFATHELRGLVRGVGERTKTTMVEDEPITYAKPSSDRSGLLAHVPRDDDGRLTDAYLVPILEHAREAGFRAVAFSLPREARHALPDGYVESGETSLIASYLLREERPNVTLDGDLFSNLIAAYGSQVD